MMTAAVASLRGPLRALLCCLLFAGACARADTALRDVPFWKSMEGWWHAENTYFNGQLDYNERSYASLVHIELDGARMRETEYKFYPAGKLAQQAGRGQLGADEGIETVTVFDGRIADARGDVVFPADPATRIDVLTADTAVRVTANADTGVDTYRMYIFTPAPGRRYRSNFGIVSATQGPEAAHSPPGAALGDLRGFSLFREKRIEAGEFETLRRQLRQRFGVRAVAEVGPDGRFGVRRLD